MLAVIDRGKPGEIYNIGSGIRISNLELARTILSLLGKDDSLISFTTDRKGHDRRYSISSDKIRNELGWTPEDDFLSSLGKTVRWYAG